VTCGLPSAPAMCAWAFSQQKEKRRPIHRGRHNHPDTRDANVIVNYVAVKHDITRELQLENKRANRRRWKRSAGWPAASPNDFNNLLTALKGYTHLSLQHMKPDDPLYHDLTQIAESRDGRPCWSASC